MATLRQYLILVFLVNLTVFAAPMSDKDKFSKFVQPYILQVIQDLNIIIKILITKNNELLQNIPLQKNISIYDIFLLSKQNDCRETRKSHS